MFCLPPHRTCAFPSSEPRRLHKSIARYYDNIENKSERFLMTGSYSLRDSEFRKWIWRLMVPLALQQLLLTGVNIVNSLMFGRFGELEIAASTQATNIVSIFITACYAFSGTGRILASQYWGKRDPRSIRTVIGISLRDIPLSKHRCSHFFSSLFRRRSWAFSHLIPRSLHSERCICA